MCISICNKLASWVMMNGRQPLSLPILLKYTMQFHSKRSGKLLLLLLVAHSSGFGY